MCAGTPFAARAEVACRHYKLVILRKTRMKIDGSCHCGYITYKADADPERTSICHCTDCQMLSGTAFRVSIPAPHHDFRILSGEPTVYVKTGESGNKRAQAFCPRCGSPIYATAP